MEELWKEIIDDRLQPGRYLISSKGRVFDAAQLDEVARKRAEGMGVADVARSMSLPRTTISSVLNGRSHWELFSSFLRKYQERQQSPA